MPARVVFVAPFAVAATVRFARAAAEESGSLGLVSQDPLEAFPESLRARLAGHWRVDDALDPEQIRAAAAALGGQLGGLDRLIGVLEQLQVPLARARQSLGVPGMDVETATRFRDKAHMKTVLGEAGLPRAAHGLAASEAEALAFAAQVGYPLVLKPPAGAGARATFRVDDDEQLRRTVAAIRPAAGAPVLLEQFLTGQERSFDAAVVDGRVVWHSISHYQPSPLEVLRTPWIQWSILLPRELDQPSHRRIEQLGVRSIQALGLQQGICHMEWFELAHGELAISELAARPPGAQLTSLIGLAHDFDLYRAWARLMIHGRFDPPPRRFAAGALFLRGQGGGRRIVAVRGLDAAQREVGELVAEVKLPQPGQGTADSYEGDGYVLLRHPDTERVTRAIGRLMELLRVETGP